VTITGSSNGGGLIGYLRNGNIDNCYATGNVSISYTSSGNTSIGANAGGLIGSMYDGIVNSCYSCGEINVYLKNTISSSGYANSCVGGLIGQVLNYSGTHSTIKNCFTSSNITSYTYANKTSVTYVGGIVGNKPSLLVEENNYYYSTDFTITSNDASVTGTTNDAGIEIDDSTDLNDLVFNLLNWDDNLWIIINNQFPTLK